MTDPHLNARLDEQARDIRDLRKSMDEGFTRVHTAIAGLTFTPIALHEEHKENVERRLTDVEHAVRELQKKPERTLQTLVKDLAIPAVLLVVGGIASMIAKGAGLL